MTAFPIFHKALADGDPRFFAQEGVAQFREADDLAGREVDADLDCIGRGPRGFFDKEFPRRLFSVKEREVNAVEAEPRNRSLNFGT